MYLICMRLLLFLLVRVSKINVSISIKVIVKSDVCTPQLMILIEIELTCRSKSNIDENQKLMKFPRKKYQDAWSDCWTSEPQFIFSRGGAVG